MDFSKIKNGEGKSPSSLMLSKYLVALVNKNVFFELIVPKDNTDLASRTPSNKIWLINDGWEVLILSPKKIAIKKFKIDTWGLRQIVPQPHNGNPNYDNFKLKVTGITRVHNEVICHTAGSTTPDGFTKAYGGNGGYNVYWYPGQFTNGNSLQGLCVQFGCGYTANNNERDDSFQIGKHPWDVGTRVCIADGETMGSWADGSYRALTIGLYGGVQNAKSWHDETGGAYKQYDISDKPIIIDIEVENTRGIVDVTSHEVWDAYLGDTKVFHKDKTLDNCWKKYKLIFPLKFNLTKDLFIANNNVKWLSPTTFKIINIPKNGIIIDHAWSKVYESVWSKFSMIRYDINVMSNIPEGVTIKAVREFLNLYKTKDDTGYKDPVLNIEKVLIKGMNIIPEYYLEKLYKIDSVLFGLYNTGKFYITSNRDITDANILIDIVPTYKQDMVIKPRWGFANLVFPPIVDLELYIDNISFHTCLAANPDFWTPVKEYYKTHVLDNEKAVIYKKFFSCNLDELHVLLPENSFLFYDTVFRYSGIKKLTFSGNSISKITSLNGIFEGMGKLTELIVNLPPDVAYLCGANDCSNAFNGCRLKTYPSNFINWVANRLNILSFTVPATLAHSMFWNSFIETIPMCGSVVESDANTILAGTADGMFYKCNYLTTVGPIVDLSLIKPKDANRIFERCDVLKSIKIKNLSHGNWYFDGLTVENVIHGNLKTVDSESIHYLFNNLTDLNLYQVNLIEPTIHNSFIKWDSSYFNVYGDDFDFKFYSNKELVMKKRAANKTNAQFIISTTANPVNISFIVEGLTAGDTLIFGTAGETPLLHEFTLNGKYTITKSTNERMGFRLLGDTTKRTNIRIVLQNAWSKKTPSVPKASLYCPKEWETSITPEMITAANAKKWSIYINNVLKL